MARRHWMLLAGIVAFGLSPLSAPAGHAEEPKDKIERPERGISMHTEYSRVTIPMGEKVRMDLTIDNRGKHDENVLVNLVSVPRGWKAGVKGGQYEVSGVPVEATKTRVLTFTAESNIIDVYVGYLRRKIDAEGEPRLLHTVRGAGYMLRGEE